MDLILTLATERPLYNSLIIEFSRWFDLSVNNTLLNPLFARIFYNKNLIKYTAKKLLDRYIAF